MTLTQTEKELRRLWKASKNGAAEGETLALTKFRSFLKLVDCLEGSMYEKVADNLYFFAAKRTDSLDVVAQRLHLAVKTLYRLRLRYAKIFEQIVRYGDALLGPSTKLMQNGTAPYAAQAHM